jgi:hypothetical protein
MASRHSLRTLAALAISALIAVGCATTDQLSEADEARLLERVEARWAAMEERDWASVWALYSPAYRAAFPEHIHRQQYFSTMRWELTGTKLLNYDSRAAVASVSVRIMNEPLKPTSAASAALGAVPIDRVERWVFREGDWWFSVSK